MPLDISIVGRELDPVEVDLTARRSLAFAAGIDDPAEAGLRCEIASPFQCAAFEWLSAGGTPPGTLGLTNEEAARVVHAAGFDVPPAAPDGAALPDRSEDRRGA